MLRRLAASLILAVLATPSLTAHAGLLEALAPPSVIDAMPEQVPPLLERAILPITPEDPTCVAIADRPPGEPDFLILGLADGGINVFHGSGTDMIARVVDLPLRAPISSICTTRLTGSESRFAILAVQGRTLHVMGEAHARIRGERELPRADGEYRLILLGGSSAVADRVAERVLVCDRSSILEVNVVPGQDRWRLEVAPVHEGVEPIELRVLSDRAIVLDVDGHPLGEISASGDDVWYANAGAPVDAGAAVIGAAVPRQPGPCDVLVRDAGGYWDARTVAVPGSVSVCRTVDDTLLLLAGRRITQLDRSVGWLRLVDRTGTVIASQEHPRSVAALACLDPYIAVQGGGRNLSIYDRELTPLWDAASQVSPAGLVVADMDGDLDDDLIVVGTRRFELSMEEVEAVREGLDEPGFMRDADVMDGVASMDRSMPMLFYSNVGALREIIDTRERQAAESADARRFVRAGSHLLTARAAAAALGDRSGSVRLASEGAAMLATPRRELGTLMAAGLLLLAGLWTGLGVLRRWMEPTAAPTVTAIVSIGLGAGASWAVLGSVAWSPLLLLGVVVAGGALIVERLRSGREDVVRPVAGAAVEELAIGIAEFTHGGSEDVGDEGRKSITKLSYFAQEMLESQDDPEHYGMLRDRLALRYKAFYPAKYDLAQDLEELGRRAGLAEAYTESLAAAARKIRDGVEEVLSGGQKPEGDVERALVRIVEGRDELARSADAARELVRRNPGCSVSACITRVLDEKREMLANEGLEMTVDLGIDPDADAVSIKRSDLYFVVENLVTNAAKAMRASPSRRISLEGVKRDATYELRVRDTGPGIPADRRVSIFIPGEPDGHKGGFGLPNSREKLRRWGGNIIVEDTPADEGATLLVTLRLWTSHHKEN